MQVTSQGTNQRPSRIRDTRRRRLVWLALAAAASGVATHGQATPAAAGIFTIKACAADTQNWSSQAFQDFATRGMRWKRGCNPEGKGLRGMLTGNVVREGRVARGARSYFVLNAPAGTQFARIWWSGEARRRDCRYALQLWADVPGGHVVPIENVRANRSCPPSLNFQAAGWPAAREYEIGGTTRIVQRAICVGTPRRPYCSARGLNYIRTWKVEADVIDHMLPAVAVLEDNPFTTGQWVNGVQKVNYDAADNVGVKLGRAVVGAIAAGEHWRECDSAQPVPCPNGAGTITVDTDKLGEGSQALAVEARDAADNSSMSRGVTIRVDNTAPGAVPVAVEGGDGWRNQNDFDLTWDNPGESDRAPISVAHYRLCRGDGSECREGSQPGVGIDRLTDVTVPGPGEWQVRVWREDAATNSEPANASMPVSLRFDPEPPQLGFEEPPASDPTEVSVLVTDRVSGLATGSIEISREGSGLWQTLATRQDGNRLIARIDDALLPPGTYRLRATARDHAGNQNSTDVRRDGQPMVVGLPIRIPTGIRAGVVRTRAERAKTRRRGKRGERQRRVVTLDPAARVTFGRQVRIGGRLENRDGQPIPGAEILVLTRGPTTAEQPAGTLGTDAQGNFNHVIDASSTQRLRFVFQGTALMLPSEREITLSVPAASTIRARPRRLRNGRTVRFVGRVRSTPIPPAGKLVELQVVLSGDWQTFRTTYTDAAGRWKVPYRFERTCGLTRYRFRARLPAEAGYPFETGVTRGVSVLVRGGACR
jgi:hypothetical protein